MLTWHRSEIDDGKTKAETNEGRKTCKTGDDGSGKSHARFVSESGRVVIDPNDWNVDYSMSLAGITPVPESFTVKWSVVPHFVDQIDLPGTNDPSTLVDLTILSGLVNGPHTMEVSVSDLRSNGMDVVEAFRVYLGHSL